MALAADGEEGVAVREIHKNGWLVCLATADKSHRPFSKAQKPEKKWVVFCVHDDKDPFLELYENRRSAFSHKPQIFYSLLRCFHVSPTIVIPEDDHVFAVALHSSVIKLSAATNEEMIDWIETLTFKLRDLGILQLRDNVYSKEPTSPVRSESERVSTGSIDEINHLPSRDPNSPLPPVPTALANQAAFNFDPVVPPIGHSRSNPNSPVLYEALYLSGRSHSYDGSRHRSESEVLNDNGRTVPQRVALSWTCPSSTGSGNAAAVERDEIASVQLGINGTTEQDIPLQNIKALSLKETQAAALKKEIAHRSGVRIVLRKRDCTTGVAFVECFDAVWVAGWKQRDHPLLHNTFHIGDKVLSVAGKEVGSVLDVQKEMKRQSLVVEFVILRVPYGQVFALKREYDGQDLGFEREGMTAEIKQVRPAGLSARSGLPDKSPSPSGHHLCNWMLTEVNNRPLNLFFKDNEVYERLNAVGLDISILVQPFDLVTEIRKQLKSIRGYKEFVVQ